MKLQVHYGITGPSIYLNDDKNQEIGRLAIPNDIQYELAAQCIRHVMHNGSDDDTQKMMHYMSGWVTAHARKAQES